MPKPQKLAKLKSLDDTAHDYVVQAFLRTDNSWHSLVLYPSRGRALRGLERLVQHEPIPKHQLRVRKWQGEEMTTELPARLKTVEQVAQAA